MKTQFRQSLIHGRYFLKWTCLGMLMGVLGGLLGGLFHHVLTAVTSFRGAYPWLIWLLPIGGMLSVALYKALKLEKNRGTNEVLDAIHEDSSVSYKVAPGIFLASTITHMLGGSAGREGAALQLGGSLGSSVGTLLGLKEQDRSMMIRCGMSAVFAGLFGTPLTAGLFVLEFICVGTLMSSGVLLCFLSAFVASQVSLLMGVHAETFELAHAITLTWDNNLRVLILGALIALVAHFQCYSFHAAEHVMKKLFPNAYLRIALGGSAVVLMTLLVGDQRFNGAGMDMAMKALEGQSDWYNFALKLLFTAVTLSAGFKGGEIVPTFCIGATFGFLAGGFLGLDAGVSAALGLVGLFCCVTNAPMASLFLSIEMFGTSNLYAFLLVCIVGFVLSGKCSLYSSQRFMFDKTNG